MSLFDIYKAKTLGAGTGSLFDVAAGKKKRAADSFNRWDEQWRNGYYSNGVYYPDGRFLANKNLIPVEQNTKYYFKTIDSIKFEIHSFDKDGVFVRMINGYTGDSEFTTNDNEYYLAFNSRSANAITTYTEGICVNISGERNGEYQPYGKP